MTTLPAWIRELGPGPGGDEGFRRQVADLERRHVEIWQSTPRDPPDLGPTVTRSRQRENARAAERLVEDVAGRCEVWPDAGPARREWRAEVREVVRRFGEERLGWPEGYRSLLLSDAFYGSTVAFAREARRFDSKVGIEDVAQALRNVWIMNSLQLLFDEDVVFSPALFAYSMLYPCTDNFLDDPRVPLTDKVAFNRRLTRRLRGERLLPRTVPERQAFALVARIERQHPRRLVPDVYRSLLAVQGAQEASLDQQKGVGRPGSDTILDLSVAKGGASLLADGYLVRGELLPEEAELCFGYGVFLQLLDDLQDVQDDGDAGHTTLFTIAARRGTLDAVTGRLCRFMEHVLGSSPRIAGAAYAARRDLVLRNCTFLLVGSVARHRARFSSPFLHAIESRWPLDLESLSRLGERARRRFRAVGHRLARRSGGTSLLDAL